MKSMTGREPLLTNLGGSMKVAEHRVQAGLTRPWAKLAASGKVKGLVVLGFLMVAALLLFYNLNYNPRSWHDEGAALSLAKTLAQDGVYAVRTSQGYQTFGPVQSAGPTLIVPIALAFRLIGAGLVQARIIAAIYALLTLVVFYWCGLELFGWGAGLLALVLLLASPNVGFLLFGRQVLGEVPALGFFLTGWLAWARGVRTRRAWLYILAGLLIGAAMLTKTQYIVMGFGTIALAAMLDLLYFRQRSLMGFVITGAVAFVCVLGWWAWQIQYFGMATFQENARKLAQLASSTSGFHLSTTIDALQTLFGSSNPVYFFWLIPALPYVGLLCLGRNKQNLVTAFLLVFCCLWLAYFTFWIIPWQRYALAPLAVAALFVAKLFWDLIDGFVASGRKLLQELTPFRRAGTSSGPQALIPLGALVATLTMSLLTLNQFQKVVRTDVLDKVGQSPEAVRSAPQLQVPYEVAAFLNDQVPKDAIVETWERELGILTDHQYHYPDQSLLAQADMAIYHNGPRDYALGADYFNSVRPDYVIIGFYGKFNQIYDMNFLAQHSDLVITIGPSDWGYDIYKLRLGSSAP
jgi:4-amino-4-deoxy-L-arabinose transferase-like glycosyltransferase